MANQTIFQVVPYPKVDSNATENFRNDHEALCKSLKDCCDGKLLEIFPPDIHNPYPIGVTLQLFNEMRDASKIIHRGIQALVKNYFKDSRLKDGLLTLNPRAVDVLKRVETLPYNIGSWRPDFLLPAEGSTDFRICEINARFPFNAFFASHEKNNTLDKLPYLRDIPIMAVHELEDIPKVLRNVFDTKKSVGIVKDKEGGWDVKLFQVSYSAQNDLEDLSYQKGQKSIEPPKLLRSQSFPKPASTIRQFSNTFHNIEARFVRPCDLYLDPMDGLLHDAIGPLEQFALECDQDCLLSIDDDILSSILQESIYINDIRTILIAHDKRLLAALTDKDIMRSYLSEEDVNVLQRHVVKTYVVNCCSSEILKLVKSNKNEWLIKPNGSGKGEGIIFGSDCCSDEEWEGILDDPARAHFILQPRIKQQTFDILTDKGYIEMLVVGLIHNFNDSFLGPGIFRASLLSSPIVNVSGGNGIILSPCVVSSRFPLIRKQISERSREDYSADDASYIPDVTPESFGGPLPDSSASQFGLKHLMSCENTNLHFEFPSHCSFQLNSNLEVSAIDDGKVGEVLEPPNYDHVLAALMNEGIVKISANWPTDEINDRLLDMVSQLGILNSHSSTESDIWDVRPQLLLPNSALDEKETPFAGNARPPRSHTSEEFPMHTDCSFEDVPPRYVLLYVVEEDRHHGGLTTLVDSMVLMRYLSKKSLAALHKYEYEMKVPPEFYKGLKTIKGRILSSGKLWRYRGDIIVRESCNEEQIAALDELDQLLQNPRIVLTTTLKKGTVFLLDNSRWFHGRTAIHDKSRWLKRIRFHPKGYESLDPPFVTVLSRSDSLGIASPIQAMDVDDPRGFRASSANRIVDRDTLGFYQSASLSSSSSSSTTSAFARLQIATKLLLALEQDSSLVMHYEYYLREQVKHVEALQFYMIDFKSRPFSLFKFSPASHQPISFVTAGAPLEWLVIQCANVIISGNSARFIVSAESDSSDRVIQTFRSLVSPYRSYIEVVNGAIDISAYYFNGDLVINNDSTIVLASVSPFLRDLCRLDVKGLQYLQQRYPSNLLLTELVDEMDVIDPLERAAFVKDRSDYIALEAIRRSEFYQCHGGSSLESLPLINGDILAQEVDKIRSGSHFDISFLSGGTTGAPKFVYRTFWEDQENARYIAKGLLASGLTSTDVVCNALSSGFWGGMHVFNLALQYIGCSLIPLGSAVPFDQTAEFLRKLKPSAILAMPTWVLSFAEYLRRSDIKDIKVQKVITGGELLFRDAKHKIQEILGVEDCGFLSTGYTSNETGAIGFRCKYAEEGYFHVHETMQHVAIEAKDSAAAAGTALALESIQEDENCGPIITSNLNRTLLPVLRYSIGDLGKIVRFSNYQCPCGRTLDMLYLYGRCDSRIRIAARDLFVHEVAECIGMIPNLALHFTIHVKKSASTFLDALEFHVETQLSLAMSGDSKAFREAIEKEFLRCLSICSPDFEYGLWAGPHPRMEQPLVVLYEPGALPRNSRTGKVSLVVDHRRAK